MMQTVKRCPFWNYWSTQIVNDTLTKGMNYDELLKTIKRFTKMLEIQYYNHPGQTTDWRLLLLLVTKYLPKVSNRSKKELKPLKNSQHLQIGRS